MDTDASCNSATGDPRHWRTQGVIDECLRRRATGETLTDDDVIAAHPDLLPELESALHSLALIQSAVLRGREESRRRGNSHCETTSGVAIWLPADAFPGYEHVEAFHRGGQAVVYHARHAATGRDVAIKVMKEGPFGGPADRARFEREIQILGQLNHANIVTIHDTGEAAGHFFFTMDFVDGPPLSEYVEAARLDPRAMLALFCKVCDAVNAAHLRGVIHRDIKPSNIRVNVAGEPIVLDFGLAKLTTPEPDTVAMTITGQFVGSMPWAAPEQAEGNPADVDLRTDVYSLGVVLFQLLTGRFPYDITGTMREVLERITRTEPLRPSSIRTQIDNEVETIVLKCLAKERDRRYQTAGELARDIHHYLAGEPIEAKRDSVTYMLRKYLRRYRVPLAFSAGFVLVIVAALIASLTLWGQAIIERDHAEAAAAEAEAVNTFLQNMLASVDPTGPLGSDVTVRAVLDQAARDVDAGSLNDQPALESGVRLTIGRMYAELGLYAAAEPHLRTALAIREQLPEQRPGELADCHSTLGDLLRRAGRFNEAQEYCERALRVRTNTFGPQSIAAAESLVEVATVLSAKGEYDATEQHLREALSIYRDAPDGAAMQIAAALTSLADSFNQRGDYAAAEPLYREALATYQRVLGKEHLHVAGSLNNLAVLLLEQERFAEAEPLLHEALRIRKQRLDPAHPSVATSMTNLAMCLQHQSKRDEAEKRLREALAIQRAALAPQHPDLGSTLANLAASLCDAGRFTEAEPLLQEALDIERTALGDNHPALAGSLFNLAALRGKTGNWAGAEAALRAALEIQIAALPPNHPQRVQVLDGLGLALLKQEKFREAEGYLRECLATCEKTLPANHWMHARVRSRLGGSLIGQQRYEEAEPHVHAGCERMPKEVEMLQRAVELYEAWDKDEQAELWRSRLEALSAAMP